MVMDYCSAQRVLHLSLGSVIWDELQQPLDPEQDEASSELYLTKTEQFDDV